jgi:amino acid transporter
MQAFSPGAVETSDLDTAIAEAINHRRLNPRQIQLTAIAGSIGAYVVYRAEHLL